MSGLSRIPSLHISYKCSNTTVNLIPIYIHAKLDEDPISILFLPYHFSHIKWSINFTSLFLWRWCHRWSNRSSDSQGSRDERFLMCSNNLQNDNFKVHDSRETRNAESHTHTHAHMHWNCQHLQGKGVICWLAPLNY